VVGELRRVFPDRTPERDRDLQALNLAEEVGELGRELNFRFGDKPRASKDAPGSIPDELGDVLFILVLLANYLGIDLASALAATLQKYERRTQP